MAEAHYRSAIDGELYPESELAEVPVYKMETDSHEHFQPDLAGIAYVPEDSIRHSLNKVELYAVHGELASVYHEDGTYGRAHSPDADMFSVGRREMWEQVVSHVLG